MLVKCTIERHNDELDEVLATIDSIDKRAKKIGIADRSGRVNQSAQFVRHLFNMIVLARVIALGAKNRDESRGAHFKPDFPNRDDANWLRTTLALHEEKGVKFVREIGGRTDTVDISLVKPRPRRYEQAGAASAQAQRKGDGETHRQTEDQAR
jgi:succinate dehydrogenase / fumarate reductase flavoprotein subunit